ncbi:hypothetical protein BGZ73_003420 [Actinomortierella ambigua]|nr:hypothetical protein BGZ73_003420 [Actinomortierella ambigua]
MAQPDLVLGEKLGSGGFGTVYKGTWGVRTVAVKKFSISESESAKGAIQHEIRLLQKLQDRHIVQFYGATFHEDRLVVIMEYAECGSLTRVIDESLQKPKNRHPQLQLHPPPISPLDWPTKARIAREIALGLAYIHSMMILHQDLKSDNVLLTRHLEVRLCDFGMSTVKTTSASKVSSDVMKGTFGWMAPEILAKRPQYSTKSDIYALGMVMWEMAANCTTPFKEHRDNLVVMSLVKSGEREDLPDDTPADYRYWVERCWEQDPKKRPEAVEMFTEPIHLPSTVAAATTTTATVAATAINTPPTTPVLPAQTISRQASPALNVHTLAQRTRTRQASNASPTGLALSGRSSTASTPTQESREFAALKPLAVKDDREAQVALARMYEKGEGIAKDDSKAFAWYYQAARLGQLQAQYRVAEMFRDGVGTRKNDRQAANWFQKAVDQGLVAAEVALGAMYLEGCGVEQSDETAMLWFRKAAELGGDAEGMFRLARMYEDGRGVEQNDLEAAEWYLKAAEKGHKDAQMRWLEVWTRSRTRALQD